MFEGKVLAPLQLSTLIERPIIRWKQSKYFENKPKTNMRPKLCDRVPMDEKNTYAYMMKLRMERKNKKLREKSKKQKTQQLAAAPPISNLVLHGTVPLSNTENPQQLPVVEEIGEQITGRSYWRAQIPPFTNSFILRMFQLKYHQPK